MIELYDVCYAALKNLCFSDFVAVLCVMLERKCKDEGVDVKGVAEKMYKTIIEVNNTLGEI